MGMTTDEKDKRLKQIITYCCEQELGDEDKINEILSDLVEIYTDDDYRHRYDEITRIIISKHTNITQIGETNSLMKVPESLFDIYCRAKENKGINNKILRKIEKLCVHVNLECIRLKNFDEVDRKTRDMNDKMSKLFIRVGNIEQQEQEITESLEKQQVQYITILGIFASIVLAFVGGLTFSTSVLTNIDKASIYRLIFVMSFIALFIGNILYYLFDFLSRIALKQEENISFTKKPIFYFNLTILFVMLGVGIVYCCTRIHNSAIVTQ